MVGTVMGRILDLPCIPIRVIYCRDVASIVEMEPGVMDSTREEQSGREGGETRALCRTGGASWMWI